jgi:hypothetical protein
MMLKEKKAETRLVAWHGFRELSRKLWFISSHQLPYFIFEGLNNVLTESPHIKSNAKAVNQTKKKKGTLSSITRELIFTL